MSGAPRLGPRFCIPLPPPDLGRADVDNPLTPFTAQHGIAHPDPHDPGSDRDAIACEIG